MSDYEIKKLQKRVTNGAIGRREFLKAASALGLAAVAPTLYTQAAYATPKKGGTYRIGLPAANTGSQVELKSIRVPSLSNTMPLCCICE